MQVLKKTWLDKVAGGVSELMGEGGGDNYTGWGGGGNGGYISFDVGGGGGFDSNGVGANSCVAPPSSGLFGYTFTETLTGAGALTGLATGLGQGVGASLAIETAGGLAGVGQMGSGAAGLIGSATLGLGSALIGGVVIGTVAYNNSEAVRDLSQAAVGQVFEVIESFQEVGAAVFGIDRAPQSVYHP